MKSPVQAKPVERYAKSTQHTTKGVTQSDCSCGSGGCCVGACVFGYCAGVCVPNLGQC